MRRPSFFRPPSERARSTTPAACPVTHGHAGTGVSLAVSLALCLIVAGCGLLPRGMEGAGTPNSDAAISSRVQSAMASKKVIDAAALHVDTMDGVVLLTGFARSSAERDAAAAAARQVRGVKAVRNQIVVKP